MKVVLDVSAAFMIAIGSKEKDRVLPTFESAQLVLAPDLFWAEASNTAWKYHRWKELPLEEAKLLASRAISLVDQFEPSETLWTPALDLAARLGHPVYDMIYLVLAQREKAALLSADKQLLTLGEKVGIEIAGI